jgi:flagellar protein FlgJ
MSSPVVPLAIGLGTPSAVAPTHPAAPAAGGAKPEVAKAAREFEAIFLRQMLTSLQKASRMGNSESSSGGEVYGSMMVGALADAVAAAGGIGLAKYVTTTLAPEAHAASAAAPGGSSPPSMAPQTSETTNKKGNH